MKKNHLIGAAMAVLLLVGGAPGWGEGFNGGGPAAPGPYKVKKGDTLWDISGSEFKDPFRWPLIWNENPKIKNPDRIYPGQEINIPAIPAPKTAGAAGAVSAAPAETAAPETAAPETKPAKGKTAREKNNGAMTPASKAGYLFSDEEILSSGFVAKDISEAGVVTTRNGGTEITTAGDDLYMETSEPSGPVKTGEKFLVAGVSKINDPATGEFAGYLVDPHGVARVEGVLAGKTKKEGAILRAYISRVFEGIMPGDVLLRYKEPEKIPQGAGGKPEVEGHVLALKGQALIGAGWNIVYLDKGSANGLKPGDVLETMKGPGKNALLQIISVEPDSATALVRESQTVVRPGDIFTGVENTPSPNPLP
ncbi:MAG: LysM peptidoglycan-binding domain-containing protein [Nitrospiraceae bacterium]|nr:LysM peptidoglycan-binding domain-containing protein [Nitrospiraceae bacterium]